MEQPVARVDPVYDTYFGTTIADLYRWMEDMEGEKFQTWIKEQGAYTRAFLDVLPEHAALLERLRALRKADPRIFDLKVAGGRVFYQRAEPDAAHARLLMRALPDGPEQVISDPNVPSGPALPALAWYVPSPDGQRLLCNLGAVQPTLHVLDVESGALHDLQIARAGYEDGSSRGSPCWLPDGSGVLYPRFGTMWLHQLGDDPGREVAVWGRDVRSVPIDVDDQGFVALDGTSNWMLGLVFHGDRHECSVYTAPVAALQGNLAAIPWRKVAGVEDNVVGYALHGDTVYLRTHQDAPRYQVVATSLPRPDLRGARVVVPAGPMVIQGMLVAGDYLLVQGLDAGVGRLRRVPLDGGEPEAILLPFDGSIDLFNNWNSMPFANDTGGAEVFFMLQSWTVSPRLCRCNMTAGSVVDTGWQAPSPVEDRTLETCQVFAPGRDGTPIPLWLIHRRGLRRDGLNPTILHTYGSYGLAMMPFFGSESMAWYERGGILAIAGVRGGGEYGRAWHEAGMLQNKVNTIDDFIACAEYLIAEGYTTPSKLAGMGISAGSYPTGGALVRRPELWGAMVIHVGEPNTIRKEQHTQANIPEIGTVTTAEGFAALQITDSYSRVEDGVPYPAVLLTTGARDTIVPVWQAAKMAARLQAATNSGKPVLLRFEEEMGHVPATEQQWIAIGADQYAFLLDQLQG